jgi:hypothetical protein
MDATRATPLTSRFSDNIDSPVRHRDRSFSWGFFRRSPSVLGASSPPRDALGRRLPQARRAGPAWTCPRRGSREGRSRSVGNRQRVSFAGASEPPRTIFERDPVEYVEAFGAFYPSCDVTDKEAAALDWPVHVCGGRSEDLHAVCAAGYVAGKWERWAEDLTDPELGLFEQHHRNEYERYAEDGLPAEVWEVVYVANLIRVQLEKFAADDGLLARLDHIYDHGVIPMYANPPTGEMRERVRLFFDQGVGVALALTRRAQFAARGVGAEPFAGEMSFPQLEPDSLDDAELPVAVRDCVLSRHDMLGYVLRYDGPMKGVHEMAFRAEGGTATIISMKKEGRLGAREQDVPLPRHVDALRALGFEEMVWPNGKRYRLASWGGLGGVRRVKDG